MPIKTGYDVSNNTPSRKLFFKIHESVSTCFISSSYAIILTNVLYTLAVIVSGFSLTDLAAESA